MIGQTLSHYLITAKLGEGGMGEVYRARDERLDREVAIKVLPEEVAQDKARLARFEREAKAVAKLAHPNILDIYDYGRDGDITYSVTELLEGETLRERLFGGALGWRKAAEIGAAIADGLGAAHEAGIVHRDLKPSNVFLTSDGRVKVLDFGLARHESLQPGVEESDTTTLLEVTDPGTVLGTVGYMSTEQVRGQQADHRSDIFSLGCVLYEMVGGQRAFTGDSAVETMNAILKEEPADLSASGEVLPPELAGTIRRCLEKQPQARFQSASDLAYNLRTISSASAPSATAPAPRIRERKRSAVWIALAAVAVVAIVAGTAVWAPWREAPQPTPEVVANRVAVAPLENRTEDPALDPLAERAADLIVQRFAETAFAETVRLPGALRRAAEVDPAGQAVAPEDSLFRFARQQGAGLLLSGAYYLDGQTLQMQAVLADPTSGETIYAFEPVTGDRGAVPQMLDELREMVVAGVGFHLVPAYDIRVERPPSSYEAFLVFGRAFEFWGSDNPQAISHIRRALELDPDFHVARLHLVTAYRNSWQFTEAQKELSIAEEHVHEFTPFERAFFRAKRAFPNWTATQAAFRQMLEIAPELSWLRREIGLFAIWLNRPREAVEFLTPIATSFAPAHVASAYFAMDDLCTAHHMLGEHEEELEWANLASRR
jgi:tetratricopeptide (TPR) repeat protein